MEINVIKKLLIYVLDYKVNIQKMIFFFKT